MAASGLGCTLHIKLLGLQPDLKKISYSRIYVSSKTRGPGSRRLFRSSGNQLRHDNLLPTGFDKRRTRFTNSVIVSCGLSSGTLNDEEESDSVEKQYLQRKTHICSQEVQSLLTTICDTASVAEFKLDLAGFQLYVKRNLGATEAALPAQNLPVSQANFSSHKPPANGSTDTASLAITKPSASVVQSIQNAASDQGLVILKSPKVGVFRRSQTMKGKRAPPACKQTQVVKEGQVICYIEQLGAEIPIESDVSGEVIRILRDDGEPVGYGDALISILPSFPGINKP